MKTETLPDTVLRIGDVIQTYKPGDYELLRGRGELDVWTCTAFPIGFALGAPLHLSSGRWVPTDVDAEPFEHHVPADFAERAALEGRIVYPVDAWSAFLPGAP